jgi:hypothetical protein
MLAVEDKIRDKKYYQQNSLNNIAVMIRRKLNKNISRSHSKI